jgi:hypothetical protein
MDQSILYADIENLQDIAKEVLIATIEQWPAEYPKPEIIKLYVRADLTELWKIWVSHNIPGVEAIVKGVQHYSWNSSKNSADIALALDALFDLLKGRAGNIAILSDDSDYVSLFAVLKQEMGMMNNPSKLFKWFMTNRPGTRSRILSDFFPSEYIQIVNYTAQSEGVKEGRPQEIVPKDFSGDPVSEEEQIALAIIKDIPAGTFRSSDCRKAIKRNFPDHSLAGAESALFGSQFLKVIWPILDKYGVKSEKSKRGPRKYEMTPEAKAKIR